ncbi:helix-turn-helix domain-containing protein [Streptomyces ardesiacus]
MLTLGLLPTQHPNLELVFAWPRKSGIHHGRGINALTILPMDELLEIGAPRRLDKGALVLVTGAMRFRIRGRIAAVIEEVLRQMSLDECAGLVLPAAKGVSQPLPQPLRDLSDQLQIPLLMSATTVDRWTDLRISIQQARLAAAERQAGQLDALMRQLPPQLADVKAMQRIASWLAHTLDVQVLVSEPDRVLAASPPTAAEQLAQAIIRQSVEGGASESASAPHTQLISLTPATGPDTVLAVARHTPFDEAETRLLRHAAKLLGLVDQARREYCVAADASRAVHTAAAQLLLDGEVDKARRVMEQMTPGLLDAETGRLFVVMTDPARRDTAVRLCETATAGHALAIADPHERNRVVVIQPVRDSEPDENVPGALIRLVSAPGPISSLGGSGVYSMSLLGDALNEAATAQRFALHQPDSVALSAQHTDLISLLCQYDAQHWARQLLHPLMGSAAQWEQMRQTLPTALAYPYTVAARRLDLHRNTLSRRVARAARSLGVDFTTIGDRIAVCLALELVTHREPTETTQNGGPVPTLRELLTAPQILVWAETLLSAAREDRRNLLATAAAWLSFDAHVEPTARSLGLSEVTVRTHIRALEAHMSRDLSSLNGMRDLQFALHVVTGEPNIRDIGRQLCKVA